jgi:hypothetical protein
MKASSCNYCRPTRAASGETLGSGFGSDDGDAAVSCSFLGASFVEQRWMADARGDVRSCLTDRC